MKDWDCGKEWYRFTTVETMLIRSLGNSAVKHAWYIDLI